ALMDIVPFGGDQCLTQRHRAGSRPVEIPELVSQPGQQYRAVLDERCIPVLVAGAAHEPATLLCDGLRPVDGWCPWRGLWIDDVVPRVAPHRQPQRVGEALIGNTGQLATLNATGHVGGEQGVPRKMGVEGDDTIAVGAE